MTKRVFYEKIGRRYRPCYEWDQGLMDAMPRGSHLVMCYPGGQSRAYNIDPNYAALIAAGRVAQEPMREAIKQAAAMHRDKNNGELTVKQKEAWENFVKVMGESGRYVHYKSVHDIADAGIRALEKEAATLMEHPAVRDAYERFLLVCKLTKEKQNDSP